MKREDDAQLIDAILSGDDTAFDILVEKYQKKRSRPRVAENR